MNLELASIFSGSPSRLPPATSPLLLYTLYNHRNGHPFSLLTVAKYRTTRPNRLRSTLSIIPHCHPTVISVYAPPTARHAISALLRRAGSIRNHRPRGRQVSHTKDRRERTLRHNLCHMGRFGRLSQHRCSFDLRSDARVGREWPE